MFKALESLHESHLCVIAQLNSPPSLDYHEYFLGKSYIITPWESFSYIYLFALEMRLHSFFYNNLFYENVEGEMKQNVMNVFIPQADSR